MLMRAETGPMRFEEMREESFRCPKCQKEGKKSTVYVGGSLSTAAFFPPFYDAEGRRHHHDGNSCTTSYSCSKGHHWADESKSGRCWCGWPQKAEEIEM